MSKYTVTASALELRSGPGTGYSIVEQLPHGTEVDSESPPNADGWCPVSTIPNGAVGQNSGWVAAQYLAPVTASTSATCCVVIDLSHHNGTPDLQQAYDAGQRGLIHKASEGTGYVDPMYAQNRSKAADAGMLWGAYHFGTGDDGQAQAQHFLATAKPDGNTLLVLDLESNPQGESMSLAQAEQFVTAVQGQTGVWPGVYGGSYIRQLLGEGSDTVLAKCWFWLAEYGSQAKVPAAWSSWTLWQYTDGSDGQSVPGVGQCDRDRFEADEQGLASFWKAHGAGGAT